MHGFNRSTVGQSLEFMIVHMIYDKHGGKGQWRTSKIFKLVPNSKVGTSQNIMT